MPWETFFLLLSAWGILLAATLSFGRMCSCYYPYLLSAKWFYRVKHPRVRKWLIATRNTPRGLKTRTAPEDRDKLSLLGYVYYLIHLPWCAAGLLGLLGSQLLYLAAGPAAAEGAVARDLAWIYGAAISYEHIIVEVVMWALYLLDYGLGSYRHFKEK